MPMGRPPKYSKDLIDKHWQQLEAMAKKGCTKNQICVVLDISHQTMYDWIKTKPEFSDAIYRLMRISQGHWESIMYNKSAKNAPGSDAMIKFAMGNMFRDQYATERVESTVQQETKLDVQGAQDILSSISVDDLKALIAQKEAETDDGK